MSKNRNKRSTSFGQQQQQNLQYTQQTNQSNLSNSGYQMNDRYAHIGTAYGLYQEELESTHSSNMSLTNINTHQTNNNRQNQLQNGTSSSFFNNQIQTHNTNNRNQPNQRRNESMRQDVQNKTFQNRNPFLDSIGDESSLQDAEFTNSFKKSQMQFKMTQRSINELTKQYANKRYGKNDRMIQQYSELVQRMLKSDEMRCSLDFLTKLDAPLFNHILTDFQCITSIFIYSDKCGPKELQRFEDSYRRGNKKVNLFEYICKPSEGGLSNNHRPQINNLVGEQNGLNNSNVNQSGNGQATSVQPDMLMKSAEKKCSQNQKINSLIVPGLVKNIQTNHNLRSIQIAHFKFTSKAWEDIGQAIGQSKSIKSLCFQACNLSQSNNLQMLMKGLVLNNSIEKLDLSDNNLQDQDSIHIVKFMKEQGEKRESTLWKTGLRHGELETKSFNVQNQPIQNDNQIINLIMNQQNSPVKNMHIQQTRYYQKKDMIQNRKGLREVILKRNYLGQFFIENLQKCLRYDRFIKLIDLQGNNFDLPSIKNLIKYSLRENTTLVSLDMQNNPGINEKCKKQIALCLLKNIELMKSEGQEIRVEWMRPEVLTFKIPSRILEGLGISFIAKTKKNSLNQTFIESLSHSNSRSPTQRLRQKSLTNGTFHIKQKSKSRNEIIQGQNTDVPIKQNQDIENLKQIVRKNQRSIQSSTRQRSLIDKIDSSKRRTQNQSMTQQMKNEKENNTRTERSKTRDYLILSQKNKTQNSSSRQRKTEILVSKTNHIQKSTEKKPPINKSGKKVQVSKFNAQDNQDISQKKVVFHKSGSFSDFQVQNLNKSSKKIDFSIVEQKVEPMEIFTNLSDIDPRETNQETSEKKVSKPGSALEKRKLSSYNKLSSGSCQNCKNFEKQYFQSEAKMMKQHDNIVRISQEYEEHIDSLQKNQDGHSLLPQTQEDIDLIKQLADQKPEKVIQRMDMILTELNFLMDTMNFQKLDPRLKVIVQQQVEQFIEIAEEKQLLEFQQDDQHSKYSSQQNQANISQNQAQLVQNAQSQQPSNGNKNQSNNSMQQQYKSNETLRSELPIEDLDIQQSTEERRL
eukprot:403351487